MTSPASLEIEDEGDKNEHTGQGKDTEEFVSKISHPAFIAGGPPQQPALPRASLASIWHSDECRNGVRQKWRRQSVESAVVGSAVESRFSHTVDRLKFSISPSKISCSKCTRRRSSGSFHLLNAPSSLIEAASFLEKYLLSRQSLR